MTSHLSQIETPMHRRTVLKGAAWAVPVIATAVAVPAFGAESTTPTNFGQVIESSDEIGYTDAPVSSLRFSTGLGYFAPQSLTVTYTFSYTGEGAFTFANASIPTNQGWSLTVSPDGRSATLTRTDVLHAESNINGVRLTYNSPAEPEQNSILASCYAITADRQYEFNGLTSFIYTGPVIGPRTPALRQAAAPAA